MTTTELETRVAKLEAEVASLREQIEHTRAVSAVQRSIEQINRGEGVPARDALEALRQKYNIPAK